MNVIGRTTIIALSLLNTAAYAVGPPSCPPDPRAEDLPEVLYTFESFTRENYERALDFLARTGPEWIEAAHKRSSAEQEIFGGEIWLGYTNWLNEIRGYVLKLEYLSADAEHREAREKAFCDFISEAVIVD